MKIKVEKNKRGKKTGTITKISEQDALELTYIMSIWKRHMEEQFSDERALGSRMLHIDEIQDAEKMMDKFDALYWKLTDSH